MSEENRTPEEQQPPTEQPAAEKKPLSEKKKAALLRYMAILFAVAFVLVLLSLVLQMHNSQATISELNETKSNALTNAEQLQAQNRDLQQEKEDLQKQLDDLSQQLTDAQTENDTLKQENETAESEAADTLEREKQLMRERTQEAYDALITAAGCEIKEGNVTFSKAMDTLSTLHIYLSDSAEATYRTLLGE